MKYFKLLTKLYENESLNYSQIPESLREELLEEDLIAICFLSASRRKIVVKKGFSDYYHTIKVVVAAKNRADLAHAGIDTKQKYIAPQEGLYIVGNAFVNGIDLRLLEEGALFLKNNPKLDVDALVIGVENFENLIYYKKELYLFEQKRPIYFVFRNKKMLELFAEIQNPICYFGDFDLAGIAIYENSILPTNDTIKFFIPHNIEELLNEYGSRELYTQQLNKYKNLQSNNKKIQHLIELIHKYQKGLEQEFFIRGNS